MKRTAATVIATLAAVTTVVAGPVTAHAKIASTWCSNTGTLYVDVTKSGTKAVNITRANADGTTDVINLANVVDVRRSFERPRWGVVKIAGTGNATHRLAVNAKPGDVISGTVTSSTGKVVSVSCTGS
jgi:hypothetical protein